MSGSFDNSDLRQAGTAAKRFHDHKAKWVHGGRSARPGVVTIDGSLPITRPAKPHSTSWNRRQRVRDAHHNSTLAKVSFRNDVQEALGEGTFDSLASEGNDIAVATTVPELYQEDGPVSQYEVTGATLFNDMIDKALEKFETKETEKLVKEYEFITRESEVSIGYLADEDDFEFVDHVKL
ncbi:uncharacterized protein BDV17DRAFT_287958 [Aspergillus undulatus]|uniref:uncharacterized protein n=1 Tax=Aspergillus undulatus TaxID=1810928 RepID=UPI003CCD586C